MSYLDFLRKLLALGPALPEIMEQIQVLVATVQRIIVLATGKEMLFGDAAMDLNATEQAAEGEVVAALHPFVDEGKFGAIGDGTLLRTLFTVIRENPKFVEFVLSLLVK